ncbi:MAG: hypothetical protein QM770_23765 [Tepidisphaeraceae bacterium]
MPRLRTILYVLACLLLVGVIVAIQLLTLAPKWMDANPPKPGEKPRDVGF